MKVGYVYLLVFANGKKYVGITTRTVAIRLRAHRSSAGKSNPKLAVHRAWQKYGEPDVQTILQCSVEELQNMEKMFIIYFNSLVPNGYNFTAGGESSPMLIPEVVEKVRRLALSPERIRRNIEVHLGSKRSDATREQMSKDRKGKKRGPQTPEHREKLRLAQLARPPRPPRPIGVRKNTPETIEKMRISAIARWAREKRNE